jgi:hypothetical protein
MTNPILIGGLMVGGAVTAWRLIRERGRIHRMVDKLQRDAATEDRSKIVRLERDPDTGVYAPRKDH